MKWFWLSVKIEKWKQFSNDSELHSRALLTSHHQSNHGSQAMLEQAAGAKYILKNHD